MISRLLEYRRYRKLGYRRSVAWHMSGQFRTYRFHVRVAVVALIVTLVAIAAYANVRANEVLEEKQAVQATLDTKETWFKICLNGGTFKDGDKSYLTCYIDHFKTL